MGKALMIVAAVALSGAACGDAVAQRRGAAAYDWSFVTHGGSGDLDFGDGDWAEGRRLLSFSCLPSSGKVELGGDTTIRLRAGGHSLSASVADQIDVDNPVLRALRATGVVRVTSGRTSRTLTAQAAGRRALRQFMDYCGAARR